MEHLLREALRIVHLVCWRIMSTGNYQPTVMEDSCDVTYILTNVQICCNDSINVCDGLSSLSQHGGLQSAWMVNLCQVSMANIVKMGRPQAKASMPNSSVRQKSFSVKALFIRSSQF